MVPACWPFPVALHLPAAPVPADTSAGQIADGDDAHPTPLQLVDFVHFFPPEQVLALLWAPEKGLHHLQKSGDFSPDILGIIAPALTGVRKVARKEKRARFTGLPPPPHCQSLGDSYLVERWFAELTNKRIRRGAFRGVKELQSAIREFIEVHNENPQPFVWTRTADQVLDSIARYARRTLTSHPPGITSRINGIGD